MPSSAMLCYAMLHDAIVSRLYSTPLYPTLLYSNLLYSTRLSHVMLRGGCHVSEVSLGQGQGPKAAT